MAARRPDGAFFSQKFGVGDSTPGEKYAQVMVDEFVPAAWRIPAPPPKHQLPRSSQVAPKFHRPRRLISHELGHQGFRSAISSPPAKYWGATSGSTRLRHVPGTVIDRSALRQGQRLRALEYAREWFESVISGKNRSLSPRSMTQASTATLTISRRGPLHASATRLAKTLFTAAPHHYLKLNRGQNVLSRPIGQSIEEATPTQRRPILHPMAVRCRRGRNSN